MPTTTIILVLCALILQVYSVEIRTENGTSNDTSNEYDDEQSMERFLFNGLIASKCRDAVNRQSSMLPNLPVTLTKLGNGHLYFFSPVKPAALRLTFVEAVQYCKDHGMHLVTINSAAENLLVYSQLLQLGTNVGPPAIWIGHRDLTGTNTYVAIQSNAGTTPTFFAAGQPTAGQCAVYRDALNAGATLSWQSRVCTLRRPFICEMEPPCSVFLS